MPRSSRDTIEIMRNNGSATHFMISLDNWLKALQHHENRWISEEEFANRIAGGQYQAYHLWRIGKNKPSFSQCHRIARGLREIGVTTEQVYQEADHPSYTAVLDQLDADLSGWPDGPILRDLFERARSPAWDQSESLWRYLADGALYQNWKLILAGGEKAHQAAILIGAQIHHWILDTDREQPFAAHILPTFVSTRATA